MDKGVKNELEIAKSYENKRFKELNDFQKGFLLDMFEEIQPDEIIRSGLVNNKYKPDIFFQVQDKIKYVSIKSGRADSMHFESIKSFILFLREFGISTDTQKIVLLFHYGDGTLDGKGKTRYNFDEMMIKLANQIQKANNELREKYMVEECLYRFVFQGIGSNNPIVDYVYFGDKSYGVYCKRDHIIKYVIGKKYEHIKTLHVGPMTIQPYLRDVKNISRHIEKREQIQVKWHYLLTDLQFINNVARMKHWN